MISHHPAWVIGRVIVEIFTLIKQKFLNTNQLLSISMCDSFPICRADWQVL